MDWFDAYEAERQTDPNRDRSELLRLAPYYAGADTASHDARHALCQAQPAPEHDLSMRVRSEAELLKHARNAHAVGEANFTLNVMDGVKRYHNKPFPQFCCGPASTSVALSLIAFGYTNTMLADNQFHDHVYVLLPYTLNKEHGAILIDPTAPQTQRGAPHVFVDRKLGTEWEYITEWDGGANLYPTHVVSARNILSSGGLLQCTPGARLALKQAFAHPTRISASMPKVTPRRHARETHPSWMPWLRKATGQGA